DVQRNCGPETDDACQRRDEESKELGERTEFRWSGEHRAEAARFVSSPDQQREADQQKEWSRDTLQEANGFDTTQNDRNVQQPEENKASGGAVRERLPARAQRDEHRVDRFAADPRLNPEPAASDQRAKNGGYIGAENAEGSARENREGNPIPRPGVCV